MAGGPTRCGSARATPTGANTSTSSRTSCATSCSTSTATGPTNTAGSARRCANSRSLFVLHRLARAWAEDPPDGVADAAAFAPHFATYALRVAERYARPGDLPRWLADHLPALEADPYGRDRNGVMAATLLPRFLESPHSGATAAG